VAVLVNRLARLQVDHEVEAGTHAEGYVANLRFGGASFERIFRRRVSFWIARVVGRERIGSGGNTGHVSVRYR